MTQKTIKTCDVCNDEIIGNAGFTIWIEEEVFHCSPATDTLEVTVPVKDVCGSRDAQALYNNFLEEHSQKSKVFTPEEPNYDEPPW